jgi:hypothetical protein
MRAPVVTGRVTSRWCPCWSEDRVSDLIDHSQHLSLAYGLARIPEQELRAWCGIDLRLISPERKTDGDDGDSRLNRGAVGCIDYRPYSGLLIRVIKRAEFQQQGTPPDGIENCGPGAEAGDRPMRASAT